VCSEACSCERLSIDRRPAEFNRTGGAPPVHLRRCTSPNKRTRRDTPTCRSVSRSHHLTPAETPVNVLKPPGSESFIRVRVPSRVPILLVRAVSVFGLTGLDFCRRDLYTFKYTWGRNRLVVAAADNDNCDDEYYPAGLDREETFSSWFGINSRTYDTELLAGVQAMPRTTDPFGTKSTVSTRVRQESVRTGGRAGGRFAFEFSAPC
jgi:hypothetical protein